MQQTKRPKKGRKGLLPTGGHSRPGRAESKISRGDHLKKCLEAEGHKVIQKGKRFLVEGFEKHLVKI